MDFPEHAILSVEDLADLIRESNRNGARFCFVLGSGASVESGIRSGGSLEMSWMNYLMGEGTVPDPGRAARIKRRATSLKKKGYLQYDFSEIEKVWREEKQKKHSSIPSKYYFDIYRLRFYPDKANGYRYMEQIMEHAKPSIGYHTLSLLLTKNNLNNLVITTNFDSLVEDALAIYTDKKPLVVAHESLAGYIELDTNRPIIAKIHRGLFFEPFNSPDETNSLRKEWKPAFNSVFQRYAPIVIGYGGGDGSLMSFLEKPTTRMKHGLYWCIREGSEPDDRIKKLVKAKKGFFVETKGFDGLMLTLGLLLYGDDVIPTGTKALLEEQYNNRMKRYAEQFSKMKEKPELASVVDILQNKEEKEIAKREESQTMNVWDYCALANEKSHAGQYEEALTYYNHAIELDPNYAVAYNNRGYALNELKLYDKAMLDLSKAIELDPDFTSAYINRSTAYHGLNLYAEAILDLDKAIELDPEAASAYNDRAYSFAKLKDYDNALENYAKAIELDPNYVTAYINRGNLYNEIKNHETAMADFTKAIDIEPDCAIAYNNRGYSQIELNNFELAIPDLTKAIELDPYLANAYNHRGYAFSQLNQNTNAIKDFTKAIELNPYYTKAYRNRAITYRAMGETVLADEDEAKLEELEHSNHESFG